MYGRRALALVAVLALAACGGGDAETEDTAGAAGAAADSPQALPPGTVDTLGMGVDPMTAGGQVIDTAAVPGPVDTAQGTPTAP